MRMRSAGTITLVALVLLGAAVGTTLVRYQSLHPCDWLRVDAGRQSGLSPGLVNARLRAVFLLRGVVTPGPFDCLSEWWRVRREGLPEGASP